MDKIFKIIKRCKRTSENNKEYKIGDSIQLSPAHEKALKNNGNVAKNDFGKSVKPKAEPVKKTAKKATQKKKK